jgi:hypothetical protein
MLNFSKNQKRAKKKPIATIYQCEELKLIQLISQVSTQLGNNALPLNWHRMILKNLFSRLRLVIRKLDRRMSWTEHKKIFLYQRPTSHY